MAAVQNYKLVTELWDAAANMIKPAVSSCTDSVLLKPTVSVVLFTAQQKPDVFSTFHSFRKETHHHVSCGNFGPTTM